jgi:hypothetical protein
MLIWMADDLHTTWRRAFSHVTKRLWMRGPNVAV